jgi:predicted regulator of Ras-like GTPase activity (Roadblock/LC7/MglB family)
MMEDVKDRLEGVMGELRRLTDIEAVAIARRDGLIVAHNLPDGVDPKKISAMSAAIVGTSEMAAEELSQGELLQTIVDSRDGKMLSTGAGKDALLVTFVRRDANMGLVLLSVERAAERVAEILSTM